MARRLILLFIVAISLSTAVSELFPVERLFRGLCPSPLIYETRRLPLPDKRPPQLTSIESSVCVDTAVYDHRPFVKEL